MLISQDADFLVLHAGIAYAAQGTAIGRMVNGLLLMFDVLTPEEMIDWIEFL